MQRSKYSLMWGWALGMAALALLVTAAVISHFTHQTSPQTAPLITQQKNPNPSAAISPQPVVEVPSPTPTSTPSTAPSASVTPSSPLVLPASANKVVASFYAAYKNKDRAALGQLFTVDLDENSRSLHSHLFKGMDANGIPGGPTLFSSNSASQSVTDFSIQDSTQKGAIWLVTVKEQRLNGAGQSAGTRITQLTLVSEGKPGNWLIDQYVYSNASSGKYSAFLVQ